MSRIRRGWVLFFAAIVIAKEGIPSAEDAKRRIREIPRKRGIFVYPEKEMYNKSDMNAALIFFGTWAVVSPFFTGNVGTSIFYSNILLGLALVLTACWRLCGCRGKKK
ncbi:MAG TPA: hypothetical protein PKG74_02625 [Candidatus Colwellbacteria bacterium]|nr:hypothetical protein [Candidatus Colwellbacteria bacterium]